MKKSKKAIDIVFPPHEEKEPVKKNTRKKSSKITVKMKKPFHIYIALCLLENYIKAKKASLAKLFKEEAWFIFYNLLKKGKNPDSFIGSLKDKKFAEATALFTLKIRQGEITDDLADDLTKLKIPFEKIVIVPEKGYRLNPNLFGADQSTLKKIAEAIKGIKGLDPSEVFLPSDPITQNFMSDETFDKIMEIPNEKIRLKVLAKVTSRQVSDARLNGGCWEDDKATKAALEILKKEEII